MSGTEILFKLHFNNPLEISQNAESEKIKIIVNLDKYTDKDGLSLPRNLTLTAYMPRQIPSEAEAATIESAGSSTEDASASVMISNCVVSLIMAGSLNQLWSMMNGL